MRISSKIQIIKDDDNNILNMPKSKNPKVPNGIKLFVGVVIVAMSIFYILYTFYNLSVERKNELTDKKNYIYIKNYTPVPLQNASIAIKSIVKTTDDMTEDQKKNLYRQQTTDYIVRKFEVEEGTDKRFSNINYGIIKTDSYIELEYTDQNSNIKRFSLVDNFSYSFKHDIVVSLINYDKNEDKFLYTIDMKQW